MPMVTNRDLERWTEELREAVTRMAQAEAQLAIVAGLDGLEADVVLDITGAFYTKWKAVIEEDQREWVRNKYGEEAVQRGGH